MYAGDEFYDDDVTSGSVIRQEDWDQVADTSGLRRVGEDWSEDDDCTWCGGEGYVECDDPIQCTRPHIGGRWDGDCECSACHGSGLAKDQTSW